MGRHSYACKILLTSAIILGLTISGTTFAGDILKVIRDSTVGFRYVFFRPWIRDAGYGYAFRSNKVTLAQGICFYEGDGIFLVHDDGRVVVRKYERGNVAVFSEEVCPVLDSDFAAIGSGIDLRQLISIKIALDEYWKNACSGSASFCSFGFPRLASVVINGMGAHQQFIAEYSTGATLQVRRVEGRLVAGGAVSLEDYIKSRKVNDSKEKDQKNSSW